MVRDKPRDERNDRLLPAIHSFEYQCMKINIVCDHKLRSEYRKRFKFREPVIFLSPDRRFGNVYLRQERLEDAVGGPLDSVSLDLSEIASYVYLADKAMPRGQYEKWVRDLSFLVPVRHPGRWNAVRTLLSNTVGTLSGDNVQFYFVKKREDRHSGGTRDVEQAPNTCSSDSVSLFSGGLDSFAGAVYLIQQGRRPLLASHYVSGLKGVQSRLVEALEHRMDVKFEHFQYRITSGSSAETRFPLKTRESTHRARSFLFMSLAAVAAKVRGFSEIFICENGVLSLNVPISDARKGSRSTRHAHPLYLAYFNQLIDTLYEQTFTVRNPFFFWTKGEEVDLLRETALEDLIHETVSCWGYPNLTVRYKDSNHCGSCLPCIVRRVSMIAAGLERFDDKYVIDIFKLMRDASIKDLRNIEDLVYFCQNFIGLSKTELLYRFPELVMVEAGPETGDSSEIDHMIRVYQRFADEVLTIARARAPHLLDPSLSSGNEFGPSGLAQKSRISAKTLSSLELGQLLL